MQHWFVYYKLDPASTREVQPRLSRMQQEITASGGVRARLMRRAGLADGLVTLLEVYDGIAQPAAFELALGAAVARAGLPAALVAQRHTERFEDL